MSDRKRTMLYKGKEITYYLGSNWAYVDDIPYPSILSAKNYITRNLKNTQSTNKKWEYEGKKHITSIRLTHEEKDLILTYFQSIQEFVQKHLEALKQNKG